MPENLPELLKEALYELMYGYTDNQQGMPNHYRQIAANLRYIQQKIKEHEKWALECAREWERGTNSE